MKEIYYKNNFTLFESVFSLRKFVSFLYLVFLIISPLLYLTGSAEFVTPLVLSNFINVPSLSSINYILLFIVVILSVDLKSIRALSVLIIIFFIFTLISFRSLDRIGFIYSLLSQFIITSPAFVFFFNRNQFGFINKDFIGKILSAYVFYCIVSIVTHYLVLIYAKEIGMSIPNERMVGIFKNPNHMAAFAILTLILFYYYECFIYKSNTRLIIFFVESISVLCVFLTGSRSAIVLLAMIVVYKKLFLLKSRAFLTFSILLVVLISLYFIYKNPSLSELIAVFSKRDSVDLDSVGNMRITILFDTLKDFSLISLLSGIGSGEGTTIFIKLQSMLGLKITWLDSNINAIVYTYGLVFSSLFYVAMLIVTLHSLYEKKIKAMMYLYICWFFWFFNVSEYFPIIFIALIITADSINNSKKLLLSSGVNGVESQRCYL